MHWVSEMALSLLPTPAELAGLASLDDIRQWTGVHTSVWQHLSVALGTVPSVRVLALTPSDVIRSAFRSVRITLVDTNNQRTGDRELSSVEVIQLALMWRIARRLFNMEDIDLLQPPPPPPVANVGGAAASSEDRKKIKVSHHADQLDDTEVDTMNATELEEAYAAYRMATGADPRPEADPSQEQLAVMYAKVIKRNESPYADFSVLTPFGRRMQKQMKARNWLLQADGSFKAVEIPGPPGFESWLACWRVYRTILLMLGRSDPSTGARKPIVTVAALEEYVDRIQELVTEIPECWHLIMQAEDRMRAEQLERIHRQLTRARLEGRLPMNQAFDPDQPWIVVFSFAARDSEYWTKFVIRPAQTFLARGGSGKRMSKVVAEDAHISDAAASALSKDDVAPGEGTSRNARKRRRERLRKEEAAKRGKEGDHGKQWNPSPGAAGKNGGKGERPEGMASFL